MIFTSFFLTNLGEFVRIELKDPIMLVDLNISCLKEEDVGDVSFSNELLLKKPNFRNLLVMTHKLYYSGYCSTLHIDTIHPTNDQDRLN